MTVSFVANSPPTNVRLESSSTSVVNERKIVKKKSVFFQFSVIDFCSFIPKIHCLFLDE